MGRDSWASSNKVSPWPYIGLVFALALALGVRIWWLRAVPTQPVTDFDWYFERARDMVYGLGYSVEGQATAYWPVGYPGFLSLVFRLFGVSVEVGQVANTTLVLGSIGLSWHLARQLFQSEVAAFLTAAALAVHPATIAYSGILASEPLYTFLILLATTSLVSIKKVTWIPLFAAGLIFGLAVLVRPQALLLPLGLLLCCRALDNRDAYKVKLLMAFGVVYGACLLTVLPWTIRNTIEFGRPVLVSTNGGDNLLIGNNPLADGKYHNPLTLGVDLGNYDEVDRDKIATAAAMAYIRANKGAVVRLWPAKLQATFLSGTDAPYWAFQKTKGLLVEPGKGDDKAQFKQFRTYSIVWTTWLLGFAAVGAVLGLVMRKLPLTSLMMIGYAALVSVIFFGNPRFAFSVIPFLTMHAAHGPCLILGSLSKRKKQDEPTAESQNS